MSRHHKRREDRDEKRPEPGAEPVHPDGGPGADAAKGALIVKGGGGGVVLSGEAASAESLPVLNALREFIEMERRRTRNRMIALGATFIVLFLIASAAAFWMARRHWDRMRQELAAERQASQAALWRTESNVADVAVAADRLRTEFAHERASSRNAESQLVARISGSTEAVRDIKDTVASLEIENAMLAYSLRDMQSNLTAAARADGQADAQLALLREELAADRALAEYEESVADPSASTSPATSHIQVSPTNTPRPVKFRLPLPRAEAGSSK